MGEMIEIEWPEMQVSVRASLLEEEEPELCEILWENLESAEAVLRHPVLTGEEFSGESRPPRHPVQSGTQASPSQALRGG